MVIATFERLPWPPSSNSQYATDYRTKRRFKSKERTAFDQAMQEWAYVNRAALRNSITKASGLLHVKLYFTGPKSQWFTKNGNVKRCDVANREKPFIDALFDILDIDDSLIFHSEQIKATHSGTERFVDCHIFAMDNVWK